MNGIVNTIKRVVSCFVMPKERTTTENRDDYEIENGILIKYKGPGGRVTIPKGVTSIGEKAFFKCSSLKSIIIPKSVTTIGDSAFAFCESLTSITIPKKVMRIGAEAFKGCKGLEDKDGFVIVRGVLYDYFGPGGDVTIPKGVTSIGDNAFMDCRNLTSIRIPESVTSIRDGAFNHCRSLTSLRVQEGVEFIGRHAFFGCRCLTNVIIPESVTIIGGSAFGFCINLTSVIIPEGVKTIGDFAFSDCVSLTSVKFPESVTAIGSLAFDGCDRLMSVIIPGHLSMYGTGVFDRCESFQYVICYKSDSADYIVDIDYKCPICYLGGPLSDLKNTHNAVIGFIHAREQGIKEIDQWQEDYIEYIKNNLSDLFTDALFDRSILLFLIREHLLDEEEARGLLETFADDIEVKAALLQYYHEKCGAGGMGDLSL